MISVRPKHFEKILLGGAVVALLAGAGWTWQQEGNLRVTRPSVTSPVLSTAAYVPATLTSRADVAAVWLQAPAQSAGEGWVYELFTPPVIYYNAAAHSFAVTPPDGSVHETAGEFGLQLVAVRLEPYRLQLTGYFGSPDDYVVAFALSGSSETVLARVGRRFERLGLTLKSFEVRKVTVGHGDPWPVYDVAGLATLQDDRSGTEVVLDTHARKLTSIPLAEVQLSGRGKARELHEGDTWVDDRVTYRVERIQLEPAEVVVARIVSDLPAPEIKIMRPLAAAKIILPSLSRNVANNGP